jgi:hypothetical protein
MRKPVYAMAVVLVALTAPSVSATPPDEFDLEYCGRNATDIVLTDLDGCVLECWRGELKPGAVVRLGWERLTPVNALPWEHLRLRPEPADNAWYRPRPVVRRRGWEPPQLDKWPFPTDWDAATERSFVLFLRKEGTEGGGAIWMPAAYWTRPRIGYWFSDPESRAELWKRNHDYSVCTAWIEGGRVLGLRKFARERFNFNEFSGSDPQSLALAPVAHDPKRFKAQVLTFPTPPANLNAGPEKRESMSSSITTVETLSAWMWAPPKK